MKIDEICEILKPEIYYLPEDLKDTEITTTAASDLMSDILAMEKAPDLLLTGLTNIQVVNTCSVFSVKAVMFVRGKKITDPKVLALTEKEGIILMSTNFSMYESCGRLYTKGMPSVHTFEE